MKNSIKERIEKQFKEMCVRKTTFKKVGVGFGESCYGVYSKVGDAFINTKCTWNGWLIPFVLKKDIKNFIENFNRQSMVKEKEEGSMWLGDASMIMNDDVLYFHSQEEVIKVECETITITDNKNKVLQNELVYDVGLGLIWEEITEDDLHENAIMLIDELNKKYPLSLDDFYLENKNRFSDEDNKRIRFLISQF